MKKIILSLLFVPLFLWGKGPKYQYADPRLNDEMENIYKDIHDGKITTKNISGTITNDNGLAGKIGEYFSAKDSSGLNAPATTVWADAASLPLTTGDWDVSSIVYWYRGGSTWTEQSSGISTTPGNSVVGLVQGDNYVITSAANTLVIDSFSHSIPSYRYSLGSATTVYLKVMSRYTAGIPAYYYRISARRIR